MGGSPRRSECGFAALGGTALSTPAETTLTNIFNENLNSTRKENVQKNESVTQQDNIEEYSSDTGSEISTQNEAFNNSLNYGNGLLNQILITCPGCNENIKPVFIPFQPQMQTGAGTKQRDLFFPSFLANTQLGSGKQKTRTTKRKKPVKRVNKTKRGSSKTKKPKKSNKAKKGSKSKSKRR